MYSKHRNILILLFVATMVFVRCFDLQYFSHSSDALTVVSIILGLYFTALSIQLGSKMTIRMSHAADVKQKNHSQLDVLLQYFKYAFLLGFWGICLTLLAEMLPYEALSQKYNQTYFDMLWHWFEAFTASLVVVTMASALFIFQFFLNAIREEAIQAYQDEVRQKAGNHTNRK